MRIILFDFLSAFNTIQPLLLREKLGTMGVNPSFTSWIMDYLTGSCVSGVVESSTGPPQGTVPAPHLFTADFSYKPRVLPHAEIF